VDAVREGEGEREDDRESRGEIDARRLGTAVAAGDERRVLNATGTDSGRSLMDQPLTYRLAAEAVGTFLFFFLGFSGIAVVVETGAGAIGPLGVAAGFGFGLTLAIAAFGHVSGGHFNPAVTAGVAVTGRFPRRDIVPYWIAQLVGGFVAVLVMAIVFGGDVTDALSNGPGAGIDDWGALLLEFIATALFVIVILTVATDERAAWVGVMAPLLIGLFIFTAATTVGPESGGSFNPARSLDPVLYNQDWSDVWIYLVGPLLGGVLGGGVWATLVGHKEALA
jgi:MIP family channel proteins